MKSFKKYKDVPKKYQFDLDSLLSNYHDYESLKIDFKKWLLYMIEVKDSKFNSKEKFLNYLNKMEKFTILSNHLYNYISNNLSINVISSEFKKMEDDLNFELHNFQKEFGSETVRYHAKSKKLKRWIKDSRFDNYKEEILFSLDKKHKLDDEIENFIQKTSRADISAYDVFSIITNSELDYGYAINSNGKKVAKINLANKSRLLKHKDESIRKSTYKNNISAFMKHKDSLSSLLYQHLKQSSTWALTRNYNSLIESEIYPDKVDIKIVENLFKQVSDKSNLFSRFFNLEKKFFEKKFNKKQMPWDKAMDLVKIKNNFTIEEAQDIVLNSLKPMGEEYSNTMKKMFDERWIDFCVVDNKRSGAYSIGGTYGIEKKFILMNFDGSFDSVSTLAHEAGHSMHSWYSDNNQPYNLSQYPIFLAEIASIFNELMLNDYLLEKNKDDEKFLFMMISENIKEFNNTVRMQSIYANYEFELSNAIDKDEPVSSFESLSNIFQKVYSKYVLDPKVIKNNDALNYRAIMIPHYYYGFYMYKYSLGYLIAHYFFEQYKNHGVEKINNYIDNFLKKGSSKWPIDLLKEAGIDLMDENFYKQAFSSLEKMIDKYEKIGKKIFK